MGAIVTHRYWPTWVAIIWLIAGVVVVATISGCREGVPAVDLAPKPAVANGTLSGTVTGAAGATAIDGRSVEVINIDTGERQRATTNKAGGFTVKLRPGKYRVVLSLIDGESLLKEPGIVDLSRGDIDAHADFVLGGSRVSRPHRYHTDDGLGAPMASFQLPDPNPRFQLVGSAGNGEVDTGN